MVATWSMFTPSSIMSEAYGGDGLFSRPSGGEDRCHVWLLPWEGDIMIRSDRRDEARL
jgi:hypothetical protein